VAAPALGEAVHLPQLARLHRPRNRDTPSGDSALLGHAGFRLFDILVPIWSPTQPIPNTLGAIAFYLVAFVVLTSYFRRVFGRHRWKQLHFTAYAAAAVFYVHGVWADPLLKNRPVDFIDAEKAYVEGCALLVVAATIWRFNYGRQTARIGRGRLAGQT
jgi:DMSO/TMAO reductase YedYZ heme-binding membrane subunit